MNPFVLLFGFSGRINRAKFWLAALIYLVFFFGVVGFVMLVASSFEAIYAALLAYVPLIISGVAVGIKRLHDRNKSGWWLLLFYLAPVVLSAIGYYLLGGSDEDGGGIPAQILGFAVLAINIWMLVELGCLRGTIGGNQYGGDPLAPQPAPPRTMVR
jgi:uncharacterized membrane protein YhaH (DUF805 family)